MYPRLTDLFRDLLGLDPPFDLYTFGLMVAVALLTGAYLTRRELDRYHAQGELEPVEVKERTEKGRVRTVKASPGVLVWPMMLLAGVTGVLGAKLFHILDNLEDFLLRPAAYLTTFDGMAFWGGFIVAGLTLAWYARRKRLRPAILADAVAPGLILGYGIGRIGCYLAGDGDWGICSSLADKPAWIPAWLWSETFPRNILGVDLLAECGPAYDGVYPTMLYEFAMASVLAAVLWAVRKHPFRHGWLFCLYLVLAGVQRFTIELIRVNVVWFEIGGLGFTQAMIISVIMVVAGVVGLVLLSRRRAPAPTPV